MIAQPRRDGISTFLTLYMLGCLIIAEAVDQEGNVIALGHGGDGWYAYGYNIRDDEESLW
jgi:hypothetical protein